MSRIWTVARREYRALFDQPTGYVLLVIFLAVNGFFFFRTAYISGVASLRPMLDLLPWLFLFFAPAVTMRTMAEDARAGMLEVVLAQPITELELLLGKYLGALAVLASALGLTLAIPCGLALGADLAWGPVLAQYAGMVLLAAGFAGVGVWASSIARSQITAFLLAVGVMFVLVLVGMDPLLVGLPPALGSVAARLGVLSHFQSIGRGALDLRDVLYFVSLGGVFLVLAYAALMRRKLAPGRPPARRLRLGTALLVGTLLVLTLAGGLIGGRLDLTPGRIYTLSQTTRAMARDLDDLVTIKVFATRELPADFALLKRDVDDVLRDLRSAGRGKIRIVERDPADDPAARQEAWSLGIQQVQFNVVGQAELQVKEGYFGLALQHAEATEVIPFVRSTDDLEYRLATAIRSITGTTKATVAFVSEVPRASPATFRILQEQLEKFYDLRAPSLADSTQLGPEVRALVLLGSRDTIPPEEVATVRRFLARGGSVLLLATGMAVSPEAPLATPRRVGWNTVLEPYGLSVRSDLAYDLVANQIITMPTEAGRVLRAYPLFLRAQSSRRSIINEELGELFFPWTSTIDTAGADAGAVTPLFLTSRAGGRLEGSPSIDPSQEFSRDSLRPRLLAALVTPSPGAAVSAPRPRLAAVGNLEFVSDRHAERAPENLLFVLNTVDWLAQDEALIGIRAKDRRPPSLVFPTAGLRELVKQLNVVGLPLLVAVAGFVRLFRRRRRSRDPYRPLAAGPETA